MDEQFEFRNYTEGLSNPELHEDPKNQSSIEHFQARLDELDDRLRNLNVESPLAWPKNGAQFFDAALDLRVKVDAVRWMLRVAKHLNGAARERVILTITNSLAQLAKAVEPAARAA